MHADKTPVTGWGVDGVPQYHGQFIAIAGVVSFRSKVSEELATHDDQAGIDVSSPLFLQVRERMMEGLKQFTLFTYKWKGREKESDVYFKEAASAKALDIARAVPDTHMASVRKSYEGKLYSPSLPAPQQEVVDVRISFTRPKADVVKIAKAVFDDPDVEPNKIGSHCFDQTLKGLKR